MIVLRPRRGLGFVGLGADPSWFSDWTSSGHNDGGSILAFVQSTPGNDFASAEPLAQATGKSIPYGGEYNQMSGAPMMSLALPGNNAPQNLWLDRASNYGTPPQFAGSWFVHPGDDVMAEAIRRFVEPGIPAAPVTPAFSQAVSVLGGQTASQAAAIQAISAQNLQEAQTAAAANAQAVAALNPQSADETLPAGVPPLSSTIAAPGVASGLFAVPAWAWALGAAAVLWFLLRGGSNG